MIMKLHEIRLAKDIDELTPAVKHLYYNIRNMTHGEMNAYTRTIENRAKELGITIEVLNDIVKEEKNYRNEVLNDIVQKIAKDLKDEKF